MDRLLVIFIHIVILFIIKSSAFFNGFTFEESVDSFAMAPGDSEVHFSFKTCNNTPVPIVIHWLDIKPDPVVMENQKFNFSVFLNVSLDKMIGNDPIEMEMSLRMKRPDMEDLELCTILDPKICYKSDVCDELRKMIPWFNCPLLPMNVAETFYRTSESPPFLIKGAFVLQLSLKEMGKPLGCLKINFCAKSGEAKDSHTVFVTCLLQQLYAFIVKEDVWTQQCSLRRSCFRQQNVKTVHVQGT